jgi:hypothetical protein
MPAGAVVGGMAALGGIGGAMGQQSSQTSSVNLSPAGGFENFLGGTGGGRKWTMQGMRIVPVDDPGSKGAIQGEYDKIAGMVNAGPGQEDVSTAYAANKDFASMLARYSDGGFMPGEADFGQANKLAGMAFEGQREAQRQAFADQDVGYARQAALMGRDAADPILAAKKMQEQTRQSSLLGANQNSWATQFAMQMPQQRLAYAAQRGDVLNGLASQAMANRQALLGLGSSLLGQERNWRLATASRTNSQESGGGLGGFISGALGGAGAGMSLAGGMKGAGFGGGGAVAGGSQAMAPGTFFGGPNPYSMGGQGLSFGGGANTYSLGGPAQYGGGRNYSLGVGQ